MVYMKKLALIFCVSAIALISGCAQNVSPNTYTTSEVGIASKVVPGVIIAKRVVVVDANSKAGGLAGAVAGGAAGSVLGTGSAAGQVVGAVGGAVVGGLIGNAADKSFNKHKGVEYIIRLKTGSTIAITQTEDLNLSINQPVLIIYGAMTRIVPDNTKSIKS